MEGTIGEIRLFSGNFAPRNWLFCSGQTLPIQFNEALYSLLGDQFGMPDNLHFNLPNLAALEGTNGSVRYIICIAGMYPVRN